MNNRADTPVYPYGNGNKTEEHKDKKTNNILLLFEKRTARSHSAVCDDGTFMFPKECIWLTACGGGDEKNTSKETTTRTTVPLIEGREIYT